MRKHHGLIIDNKELMSEWDWEENKKEGLDPHFLTGGSIKKAHWICLKCKHKWVTRINHRVIDGTGCPECKNKEMVIAPYEKSLAALFPKLSKEWSKKNLLTPDMIYPQSNLPYWWICPNGHPDYEMPASKRVGRGDKCPICSNRAVVKGINDLVTTYPSLMEQWDWEENNKIGLDPATISYGSKESAHWKCKRGHRWKAVVYSRTTGHCNCSKCSRELRTSYPEKIIAFYISMIFKDTLENYRGKELNGTELDVYVPSIKFGIEYDGSRWHKKAERDLSKDELCEKLGILLIRVRENGCAKYESNSLKIYINEKSDKELSLVIKQIIAMINKKYNYSLQCDVDLDRDGQTILSNVLSIIKENSVANSDFASEWDRDKNKDIDPEYVSKNSNKRYFWLCKDYKHSWKATASHRAQGRGCPYCSGQKVLAGFNDLQSQFPKVAEEWDYELNKKKPNEVTAKSNKRYHWICSKCNHRWKTGIYVRTAMGCGCPECKKDLLSKKLGKRVIDLDTGIIYDSACKASKETGISQGSISSCCSGKTKTAGKHHWKLVK